MGSPRFQKILSIETSCDDTAVAVVDHHGRVLGALQADQNAAHLAFGGVVPEIACRNHTYHLLPLVEQLMQKTGLEFAALDGFVVTSEPGLIGSLLVGLVTAKSLSLIYGKPFIGVNHLEGHLLAPFLTDESYAPPADFTYPYIALAVSGGHTALYLVKGFGDYQSLGRTHDDAAGEAFDKFAKMSGLGFPGGVLVDKASVGGDPKAFVFPRPMLHDTNFDFSFSGLKTAAMRTIGGLTSDELRQRLPDLCASYQEAIVDVLLDRLFRSAKKFGVSKVVVTGGVSANSRLRARAMSESATHGLTLVIPPIRYCTDNAAMIGFAGIQRLNRGESSEQNLAPKARAPLGIASVHG